jgi:hypothetical protein
MEEFLQRPNSLNPCVLLASQHERVWIVSVTNSPDYPTNCFEGWEDGPVPLVEDGEDRIALAFDDIEPRRDGENGVELNRDSRFVYFDEPMAKKVCVFIDRAHKDDVARRDLLLVNCHAGVSRSGAIADFARAVLGIDYEEFKRHNAQIVPNTFVRRTLLDAWEGLSLPWPSRSP